MTNEAVHDIARASIPDDHRVVTRASRKKRAWQNGAVGLSGDKRANGSVGSRGCPSNTLNGIAVELLVQFALTRRIRPHTQRLFRP